MAVVDPPVVRAPHAYKSLDTPFPLLPLNFAVQTRIGVRHRTSEPLPIPEIELLEPPPSSTASPDGPPLPLNPASGRLPTPPSDAERYQYFGSGRRRYLLLIQYVAFLGVLISLLGFSTISYWTLIFGIPLVIMVIEQSIALYTSTFRPTKSLRQHRALVASWKPNPYPSVDVFLPTCGEEIDLLDNTMDYLSQLEWPGPLLIHILDDSGRQEVQQLAEAHRFSYLARPGREYKKAGNLRFAAERTSGEFIAILDADFVPRPDFLTNLMPYFDDSDIGIVQSPQYFATDKSMHWVERTAGATQEFFYRFIQPSRDCHSAAICVGSSAIYDRHALNSIGGFPKVSHSEDVFTGFEMAKKGRQTIYVPAILSRGLCPENLESFIAQQYRWCGGSMSMLISRDFHVDDTISVRARLSFWSGFLYYIGTAFNALLLPLPAITMAWFYPQWVRPYNMIWLVGILVLWFVMYPLVMTGRWRIEVLRLQTVYGFAHVFSILHMMTDRVAEWHPTGSESTPPIGLSVKRFYSLYLGIGLLVLGAGLAVRSLHHIDRFWPMICFSLLNLYIAGPLVWDGLADELSRRRQESGQPAASARRLAEVAS